MKGGGMGWEGGTFWGCGYLGGVGLGPRVRENYFSFLFDFPFLEFGRFRRFLDSRCFIK